MRRFVTVGSCLSTQWEQSWPQRLLEAIFMTYSGTFASICGDNTESENVISQNTRLVGVNKFQSGCSSAHSWVCITFRNVKGKPQLRCFLPHSAGCTQTPTHTAVGSNSNTYSEVKVHVVCAAKRLCTGFSSLNHQQANRTNSFYRNPVKQIEFTPQISCKAVLAWICC